MIFLFLDSSLAHLEPKLQLLKVSYENITFAWSLVSDIMARNINCYLLLVSDKLHLLTSLKLHQDEY